MGSLFGGRRGVEHVQWLEGGLCRPHQCPLEHFAVEKGHLLCLRDPVGGFAKTRQATGTWLEWTQHLLDCAGVGVGGLFHVGLVVAEVPEGPSLASMPAAHRARSKQSPWHGPPVAGVGAALRAPP